MCGIFCYMQIDYKSKQNYYQLTVDIIFQSVYNISSKTQVNKNYQKHVFVLASTGFVNTNPTCKGDYSPLNPL